MFLSKHPHPIKEEHFSKNYEIDWVISVENRRTKNWNKLLILLLHTYVYAERILLNNLNYSSNYISLLKGTSQGDPIEVFFFRMNKHFFSIWSAPVSIQFAFNYITLKYVSCYIHIRDWSRESFRSSSQESAG